MNPTSLSFTRQLRSSHDATIYFTPNSTGAQIYHPRAHVFILSDLFLVAEWMEVGDKAAKAQLLARDQPERVGQGGPMPEMWLSYPPLAGKHLSVSKGSQSTSALASWTALMWFRQCPGGHDYAKRDVHHPCCVRNSKRSDVEGSYGLHRICFDR